MRVVGAPEEQVDTDEAAVADAQRILTRSWFEEYMTEDAEIILIGGCKLLRA